MSEWDVEVERKQKEKGVDVIYHVPDEQYEQMKQRFVEYLEENEVGYPSEIAKKVGVPIPFSLKIITELEEEGKIEEV